MLIRCVSDSGASLPPECIDERRNLTAETVFPLTPGREYVVYGVTQYLDHIWYYVFDDDNLPYPVWKPAALFEVADPRVPEGWCFVHRRLGDKYTFLLSFREWAEDHYFYERLVDGDSATVEIFTRRRAEANI
jgi:hypothetical protein